MRISKKRLVKNQEGFSEHVDPKDNSSLDFDRITTGSRKHLNYVDSMKKKRCKRIRDMEWGGNPWKSVKKRPLVRDQEGFSEHVDLEENPDLDFDKLTIGSNKHLNYLDDGKNKRHIGICNMDWGGNPWKSVKKRPLVRDQEGFSEHVDPEENPGLDFDRLTTGSHEHLNYLDDGKNKSHREICNMDWGGNPWKSVKKRPLVCDQEGFSEHVDPEENPGLDFDRLTTGSNKHLNYLDDGKIKRNREISKMDWGGNPWKSVKKRPLVCDQEGVSKHVDPEENPGLDFDRLTTGSREHLNYVDGMKKKRCKRISVKERPLVRDQEGFLKHVDPEENPGLDFDRLTTSSHEHLYYLDDGKIKRHREIRKMDWGGNPWKSVKKRPLVRDQEGFSKHVDPEENSGLDFDRLTTSSHEHLYYLDDGKIKRHREIRKMDWGGNPWKSVKKRPLVRDQEGFSKHVDPEENPGLDFDRLTTGSGELLHYVDDGNNIRDKIINSMDWGGNPWKSVKKRSLVRDQEGFSKHVDPEENPGLDFDRLTTGSHEHLNYLDDGKNKKHREICNMDWGGNPWKGDNKDELVGEDPGFWNHCDETDPCKISSIKKLHKMSKYPVKMHCDKGHHYSTTPSTYFSDMKNNCPYCFGRLAIQGETDAVTADPELEEFFVPEENSIDIHRISSKSGGSIKWKCPFCGHRFKKSLPRMVNCHPKCRKCRDTGIIDLSKLNKAEIPHIVIVQGRKDA